MPLRLIPVMSESTPETVAPICLAMKKTPNTARKKTARAAKATPDADRFGVQPDWCPLLFDKPPFGADEIAHLAAAMVPESVKQGLAIGDLWPELESGYFASIVELDNAVAAAAYILNRACEHAVSARSKKISHEAEMKENIPFTEAAKQITRENRADRAEAKLADFLVAAEGREEKARHFDAWKKDGVTHSDMIALNVTYVSWKYKTNKRHREKIQEIVLAPSRGDKNPRQAVK